MKEFEAGSPRSGGYPALQRARHCHSPPSDIYADFLSIGPTEGLEPLPERRVEALSLRRSWRFSAAAPFPHGVRYLR